MLQKLFLYVLDMSIVASIVIVLVFLIRLMLQRAPKVYSYGLWAVVLFRLLCPFSIESAISLIPKQAQNIPQEVALETTEYVTPFNAMDAVQRSLGDVVNGGIDYTVWVRLDSKDAGVEGVDYARHVQVWLLFLGVLWPVGMVGMLLYSGVSYVKLRRKLIGAVALEEHRESEKKIKIYLADYIESPFVMGLICPKIYLPSSLTEGEREYILLHEQHHIHRGDHIVKFLAFLALCIHWFNPLVWVAFVLAAKDMEMSCDEAVVKKLGKQIRADYSASLLKLATGKHMPAGMPLAFGEGDTKGRIKNLAKWRKPKVWISVLAVVICIIVAVVCFVNPKSEPDPAVVVGEYDVSKLAGEFLSSGNSAYNIGVNAYGMPVFKDYEAAFGAMEEDYAEAIIFIQEQYDLQPLTMKNYEGYVLYGAQVVSGDEEMQADCMAVAQFLDLYENSFDYGSYIRVDFEPTKSGDTESFETDYSFMSDVNSVKAEVVQGASYLSYSCAYMNPLSSTFSNGDTGYRYIVGADSFTLMHRGTGKKTVISNPEWGWQAFPWTDEQWNELYIPGSLTQYDISTYYEEMWYQPISEKYCLLSMDGELWLVEMHKTPQNEPYIWSIFKLMPETVKRAASGEKLNAELLQFSGMTCGEYKENTAKLLDSDKIIRVEGKIGSLCSGYAGERSVEEFVEWLGSETEVDYEVKYGAGSMYYVGIIL